MAIRLTVDDNTSAVLTLGANDETTLSADATTVVAIDNYNDLRNKPQIEGVELVGDKSLNDLGAYTDDQVDTLLSAKADRSDIPSLDGYATEQWVEDKHYLTTETDPVFKASVAYGITASDVSNWNNKSDFSGNYNDLTNKPTIPSKTSQLTNDSGFITDAGVTSWNNQTGAVTFTETDPTVPAWAKAPNKPTYTASEVGAVPTSRKVNNKALSADITLTASDVDALPSNTPIPTKTSDLTNDSGFLTSAVTTFNGQSGAVTYSAPVSSVNGQTGAVSLSIPTKTSDLTNDSGFVDASGASASAPVQSVNGDTGTVVLDADDIGALPTTEKSVLFYGQVDSTSTATVFTAQIDGITEYFDGLTVMLKNGVVTSASGFTININGLGAKHAYSNMAVATAETTIFNVNYTMLFTYDSTRVEGGGWILYRGYNSDNNTIGYQLRTNSMSLPMKSITYRYRLLFESADGKHYVPANNSTSTNATAVRTVCQDPIDPFGEIRYYGTTASVAAGTRPSATALWQQYAIALGYSFNRTGSALTLTSWKPVYVKCAPQSDGSAIIDSTTPYVQDLPTTEDGKIYIYLGVAYSATNIELTAHHPVYWYKDGQIRPYTNASASSGGVTSWNGLTGDVTYTAPVTSVNGNTGAVIVTEGLAPLIGTTSTITPQQVMTALGEGRDICIEAAGSLAIIPLALKFTAFNRATDTAYSGAVVDIVASQTIINNGGAWYVYTLWGGSMQGQSIPWTVNDTQMVPATRTINGHTLEQDITISLADLNGVSTSRRINNKQLTNDITLYAADVYATPNLAGGTQNTVCFGDSLFGMYRGDDSAVAYAQKIAGGIVRNVGFGGCRMSVHPSHGYAEFSMWALAKAVAENDFTAQDQYASSGSDYFADQLAVLKGIQWAGVTNVVIHYGTNDFQGNVPLDDATHSNSYNTICGALRYSIEKLLAAYPHLKIFVSLPVFRYWTEGSTTTYSDTKTNSNGITLPEVCKALNNVAYEYGLPVIDGYNGLGVNKVNASYYYTDGTHHNASGRLRFGRFIGRNLISPQPAHYIGSQEEGSQYTNMLDEAGWTDGVRLSSSGADSTDSGFVTSGYIPCQYLDYIYLKNISYNSASSSASSQRICFYDSSKTFISGCISGANATAQLGKEYDSNNDLVKFQIANVGSYSAANAAYFRICAPHIGSDSIITVNEPIE